METELKLCKFAWGLFNDLAGDNFIQLNIPNVCSYSPIPLGDPHNDPNAQGDAFKTLFVARVVSVFVPVT